MSLHTPHSAAQSTRRRSRGEGNGGRKQSVGSARVNCACSLQLLSDTIAPVVLPAFFCAGATARCRARASWWPRCPDSSSESTSSSPCDRCTRGQHMTVAMAMELPHSTNDRGCIVAGLTACGCCLSLSLCAGTAARSEMWSSAELWTSVRHQHSAPACGSDVWIGRLISLPLPVFAFVRSAGRQALESGRGRPSARAASAVLSQLAWRHSASTHAGGFAQHARILQRERRHQCTCKTRRCAIRTTPSPQCGPLSADVEVVLTDSAAGLRIVCVCCCASLG